MTTRSKMEPEQPRNEDFINVHSPRSNDSDLDISVVLPTPDRPISCPNDSNLDLSDDSDLNTCEPIQIDLNSDVNSHGSLTPKVNRPLEACVSEQEYVMKPSEDPKITDLEDNNHEHSINSDDNNLHEYNNMHVDPKCNYCGREALPECKSWKTCSHTDHKTPYIICTICYICKNYRHTEHAEHITVYKYNAV